VPTIMITVVSLITSRQGGSTVRTYCDTGKA